MAGINGLRDHPTSFVFPAVMVRLIVAHRIHSKMTPVHMHRMGFIGGIDPSPGYALAGSVGKLFGVRPRLPVDHPCLNVSSTRIRRGVTRFQVVPQHEDAIVRSAARSIDDQCTLKLTL